MNPEVIVKIKPDGTTTVEASNVQGTSCSLHTAPFIAALGKGKRQTIKPEMFEETTLQQQVRQ